MLITLSKNFVRSGYLDKASSLTFSTLFSIIPFLAVSTMIFAHFPIAQQAMTAINHYLLDHLLIDSAKNVQHYLLQAAQHAQSLSWLSITILSLSLLHILITIINTLNRIYGYSTKHYLKHAMQHALQIVLVLISIIICVALSTYLSLSAHLNAAIALVFPAWSDNIVKFLLLLFAFIILYRYLPMVKIRIRDAAFGAVFSASLLTLLKWLFVLYWRYFSTYKLIYGAIASIPFFLLWVHALWIITLFGAQLSYSCYCCYKCRQ